MLDLRMSPAVRNAMVTSSPATYLDPMADEDSADYIPTVDILRMAFSNFERAYIRAMAVRNGYHQFGKDSEPDDDAVAIEITCRELVSAQPWLIIEDQIKQGKL
jgi:hypothetical protein